VRGLLDALGFTGPVRSPTFNLIQVFPTDPPVLHADLYRLAGAEGIGLEDYFDSHVCLIEWADRAPDLRGDDVWQIDIQFASEGRRITVRTPQSALSR
jgi:tRNA threonylcarbamoyladenosine biosynthesis protein TsaE